MIKRRIVNDNIRFSTTTTNSTSTPCIATTRMINYHTRSRRIMFHCIQLTILLVVLSPIQAESPSASSSSDNITSSTAPYLFLSTPTPHSGPIDDASCNVEQLEEANDSQLSTILEDLKGTSFFRNFVVDLDAKCPLAEWGKSKKKEPIEDGPGEAKSHDKNDEEEEGCASEGLPDADPNAEPACALASSEDEMMPWKMGGSGFGSASATSSSSTFTSDTSSSNEAEAETKDESTSSQPDEEGENEEFECDGGNVAEEMDDDAPPLCQLNESNMSTLQQLDPYQQSKTPLQDLLSSALNAMNSKLNWDSDHEKETFTWSNPSDPVVVSSSKEEGCDDELVDGELPDTFWLDMCANIKEGDGIKVVDLMLNPERNTGYNGTHIWRAIYEENCIGVDRIKDQPMCYEERVLYRLLSGLHTSTTLSIAKNYYPPNKRKGRENWEPNPKYFYDQFHENPEYIRNLHFSYLVLLRALKKASPVLSKYEIHTGNIVEDETATVLLRRLLESSILTSCVNVFHAFDESLMFKPSNIVSVNGKEFDDPFTKKEEIVALQQNFKGVFHNISSILDCVQCQQCKLHGKMSMLGYGTALKILFTSKEELIEGSLSKNEVVAFINTIAKMSEAMTDVRELTHLYWDMELKKSKKPELPGPVDAAVGLANALSRASLISSEMEAEIVNAATQNDEGYLELAQQFLQDLQKYATLVETVSANTEPDAVVVGTGLAGLSASLNILDRGGRVFLIEKEHLLGGNSNKASSGINACCPNNSTMDDDIVSFHADTTKSAGVAAQAELIQTLVENSASAVTWLKERAGVDLSLVAQLGGHQHKRTHRPKNGMVGAEVIYGMQKAVRKFEKSGMVKILTDTKVTKLLRAEDGTVVGVELEDLLSEDNRDIPSQVNATSVILATGGFASDRSENSYLSSYRPELLKMPATAGSFSTGDGIGLATSLGAGVVDMDKVQIHPTGWVNPLDPDNKNKVLAAELMRGVGGILINDNGSRFSNELGTRAYVTDMMLSHDEYYAETGKWNIAKKVPTFALVLSSSAADDGKKHVDHYVHKGLLKRIEGVEELANWMNQDAEQIRSTLLEYRNDAEKGIDQWGKTSFQGIPGANLDNEIFYAGRVTPVLHYCMGGITIDSQGNVLDEDKNIIKGLYAAGEVTGGVHGNNRLGGNSLLECTVYGTIVGKRVPVVEKKRIVTPDAKIQNVRELKDITSDELSKHNTRDDCWVAIFGHVYDLTSFVDEHPAGAESIYKLGGQDGTEAFQSVHNQGIMEDFEDVLLGKLTTNS